MSKRERFDRNLLPELPEWRERLIRLLGVITLAYTTYYIAWRWTATLNPDAIVFSAALAAAESFGLFTAFLAVLGRWKLLRRRPLPPLPDRKVDVFITVYNEPLEILRRTALAAKAIRYPHRTYVLDDGKRAEVRELAASLDIGYIRREGSEHAKAGNLNNALQCTAGEFILQLDADHVAMPAMIDRLLGFMADERVAFVQSPQDFYNTDAFTFGHDDGAHLVWEDQRLFFSVIQPGKDRWNAAFFVGSCALIRRRALEEIGGFATHSITEDIETSLLLHSRGWRSVFYPESLAYGLAAGSAEAFHVQHLRWGQGAMQVLRHYKPLRRKGLTLPQRLLYLDSLTTYLGGYQKAVLYLAPLVFLFSGVFPVRMAPGEFLLRFVPYLGLMLLLSQQLGRGRSSVLQSERLAMAKFFTHMRAVTGYFAWRPLRFNVTPKGAAYVPFRAYAPQLFLVGLTLLAMLWGVSAQAAGWLTYGPEGWGMLGFGLNLLWAGWTLSLAWYVVRRSLHLKQQRSVYRFPDTLPILFRVLRQGDGPGAVEPGVIQNLSTGGMGFRSAAGVEPGSRIEVTSRVMGRKIRLIAEVVQSREVGKSPSVVFLNRARILDIPPRDRDTIELYSAQFTMPLQFLDRTEEGSLISKVSRLARAVQREQRAVVNMVARLSASEGDGDVPRDQYRMAVLQDISRRGARLVVRRPIPPGSEVSFEVTGTALRGKGQVVYSKALELPGGVRFLIGVRRYPDETTGQVAA